MNWLVTIVIGGIVGWLASIVMKTNAQMGLIANVLVGIVGSSLGFWLAGMLGLGASGPVAQWLVSIVGAAILIVILKALGIFK
ncbi:MAG TPA: GlsB/YeaQ/YmgE family stress response membrane protein [Vicinamibacterales bacterium]|nr:GlsB/YeaQ/YmgE family stress response membrane protein [Vicinamibacterales bacterium]